MIDDLKTDPKTGVPWLGEVPEHWGVLPSRVAAGTELALASGGARRRAVARDLYAGCQRAADARTQATGRDSARVVLLTTYEEPAIIEYRSGDILKSVAEQQF